MKRRDFLMKLMKGSALTALSLIGAKPPKRKVVQEFQPFDDDVVNGKWVLDNGSTIEFLSSEQALSGSVSYWPFLRSDDVIVQTRRQAAAALAQATDDEMCDCGICGGTENL